MARETCINRLRQKVVVKRGLRPTRLSVVCCAACGRIFNLKVTMDIAQGGLWIQELALGILRKIVSGGEHRTKKVVLKGDQVHPSVERAVNIIKKNFQKLCLEDQDILGDKKSWDKVLALISDDDLRQEIEAKFPGCKNGVERWNVLRTKCLDYAKTNWKNKRTEKHLLMEIILQFAYPRLDIAVSKGLNHLLKAPFCIHPKTGRVCVPFRAVAADKFNPSTVPTVLQLMEEIDTFSKDANEDMKRVKDYKKTSLKEAVTIFEEFLSNLAETWKGELMKASDASLKF